MWFFFRYAKFPNWVTSTYTGFVLSVQMKDLSPHAKELIQSTSLPVYQSCRCLKVEPGTMLYLCTSSKCETQLYIQNHRKRRVAGFCTKWLEDVLQSDGWGTWVNVQDIPRKRCQSQAMHVFQSLFQPFGQDYICAMTLKSFKINASLNPICFVQRCLFYSAPFFLGGTYLIILILSDWQ